jgi:beta-lactamase regulating signal transducer with metallopeptidase domain
MPSVHMEDSVLAGLAEWGRAAFAGFAHAAAPAAVAALWQDTLVALALVLCLQFVIRVSAAHRFAAWAAGFAVAALLPFLEHSGAVMAAPPAGAGTATPLLELDSRWGFAVAAFWLAASTFRAAELVFHSLRLRRLWHGATPVEVEGNLRSLLATALPARAVEICTTPDLDRPSVIGFFAPRILIPEWLHSRLTPGELEQVVLHEAEHLRRRDDWTNLLQKLSLVLFPLNPALAWMERRLCREREMACDEGVVQRTQAPRTYAACLTSLAERGLQHRELQRRELLRRAQALSLGALGRRPELVSRVDSILRRKKALHPLAAGALVGMVGCGLLVGAVELSRSPQLVAFVAAPNPDAQTAAIAPPATQSIAPVSYGRRSEPSPTAEDTVFHPSERYRAFETKSTVPEKRDAATPVAARARQSEETVKTAMTDREAAPHQVMVNAAASTRAAASSQGQDFIVLTAWEEVETSAPQSYGTTSREVADYETGAATQMQSDDAASESNTSPAAQISVTRLILLVYPANAATGSPAGTGSDPKPAHTTSSRSRRPTASPFDGGWLFFQL